MGGVTSPAKDVSQIVFLGPIQILPLRHSVVESAVDSLRARATSEVYAKISRVLLLKVISLGEASVDFRMKLGETGSAVDMDAPIGEVLVVPDVVVIVAFLICSLFLRFFRLTSCRPLHPLVDLLVHKFVEFFDLRLDVRLAFPVDVLAGLVGAGLDVTGASLETDERIRVKLG